MISKKITLIAHKYHALRQVTFISYPKAVNILSILNIVHHQINCIDFPLKGAFLPAESLESVPSTEEGDSF